MRPLPPLAGTAAIAALDGDWYESTMTCPVRISAHDGFALEHGAKLPAVRR